MSGGDRKLLGRWGEEQVARDLRKKGCSILAAGWHCRLGEIDLIVSDGVYIRFIEVKLRKIDHFLLGIQRIFNRDLMLQRYTHRRGLGRLNPGLSIGRTHFIKNWSEISAQGI